MIFVPLPLFLTGCAAILGIVTVTRTWLDRRAKVFFVALACLIMVETVLVALRFAYQVPGILVLQRLFPFWLGPLLYLGFVAVSDRSEHLRRSVVCHLGCAAILTVIVASFDQVHGALDMAIVLSYAVYAAFLMQIWRGGPDRLSQLAVAHIPKMRRLLMLGVLMLGLTCMMDTAIAIDFARNQGENVSRLLSFGSLILILLLGGAAFWVTRAPIQKKTSGPEPADDSAVVVARATSFLTESRLYTDPTLSLTRLARRVGVTDRALSSAINRETGSNVSQFINGFRVNEAAHLLRSTKDPVGVIGEASGFLTRSNFYTEFQRVYDLSPGAFRKG